MKSRGTRVITAVALLGLLTSIFACSAPGQAPTQTANMTRKQTPTPPKTAPKATGATSSPHITADGTLAFIEYRKLTFGTDILGRVARVNVKEMDRVTSGQVLAKLDSASLERTVKAAEIAVQAAEILVSLAEGERQQTDLRLQSAEADLKKVQDSVKSAQIDLDLATDDYRKITYPYTYSTFTFDVPQAISFINEAKREMNEAGLKLQAGLTADESAQISRQLQDALDSLTRGNQLLTRGQGQDVFQSGQLSSQDFWTLRAAQLQADKARLTLETAQTEVNKTALALAVARAAYKNAQLAVDKANKDLESAKNEMESTRDKLKKTVITAPFDGLIARVHVKEGDFWSDVNTKAVEIIVPTHMELDINVGELDILNIKLGQTATITVYALPENEFHGTVTSVSPLPASGEGEEVAYQVKLAFDVPEGLGLKSGMSGAADIAM